MQQEVDGYIRQFEIEYFSPLAQLTRLTGEIDELAREVSRACGEKDKRASEPDSSVTEELGDALFVAMVMANLLNINLADVFEKNMEEFNQRDRDRFERKDR